MTSIIKKGVCGLGILFTVSYSWAQIGIFNTAKLVYSNGVQTVLSGANANFENWSGGNIISDGTGGVFKIEGNLTNNGSDITFGSIDVKFTGSTNATLSGTHGFTFTNFEINKTASNYSLTLGGSPLYQILNELKMTQGQLDLRDYSVDLSSTGFISNETNSNRIKATDGTDEGRGQGTISTTRWLSSGDNTNVAGLGIDIYAAAGSYLLDDPQQITRGHQMLPGSGTFTGNYSVNRWFYVPDFQQVGSNNLTFHYFPAELNGHIESELVIYQELQNGDGNFWAPINTAIDNTHKDCYPDDSGSGFYTLPVDEAHYNYVDRFTLGSLSIPLPIQLTKFEVACNGSAFDIDWTTASEINNHFFAIERSTDGVTYNQIATINGAGNSNQPLNYHYTDQFSSNQAVYYRLSQQDFDNTKSTFSPKSDHCEPIETQKPLIYSPNQHDIVVEFTNTNSTSVNIAIYNDLGQLIYQLNDEIPMQYHKINISDLSISPNIVFVKLIKDGASFNQKIYLCK